VVEEEKKIARNWHVLPKKRGISYKRKRGLSHQKSRWSVGTRVGLPSVPVKRGRGASTSFKENSVEDVATNDDVNNS